VFHFRTWYRDHLAGYVREMLLDPRSLSRSYVERRALEAVVQSHLKGYRNYAIELHKLLTLEIVHRLFLDRREIGNFKESPAGVFAGATVNH
jgi:asparagine synthase (glutamine-hydrolysing)